ncbi:MAG: hypothetical protein WBE37_18580 [Bryobacteraceae bacterium]
MRGDFVIQVRPEVDLERGILPGRVEHMDSGHSTRFRTVQELLSFILQHVAAPDAPDADESESR